MTHTLSTSRPKALAHRVLAISAALIAAAVHAAAPSQDPLQSSVAPPPAANVMVTVDDSGSMAFNYMPEGSTTVNGVTVPMPAGSWYFISFPGDPTDNGLARRVPWGTKASASLFQRQMRSVQVNRIYYDPAVTYRPWLTSDGVTRMAPANPAAVRWNPLLPAAFDIRASNVNRNAEWCNAFNGPCASGNRRFWYGLYYVLRPGTNPNVVANYDEYDVNNTSGGHAPATKAATRTDCAAAQCTQLEERQNFANWAQYYRSRILLTKAAVSDVLSVNYANPPRFGTASINKGSTNVDGVNTAIVRLPVREHSVAQRTALINDVQGMVASGGTPLKNATTGVGNYFARTAAGNPWRADPASGGSAILACRRSYNILMTDGYYNGTPSWNPGNEDGNDGTVHTSDITGVANSGYTAVSPYSDGYSDTLTDYAAYYYKRDLQPAVQNKVLPITGELTDPAFWQHLSMFTVGIGVSGTLPATTDADKVATLAGLSATPPTLAWPDPEAGQPQKIDDMFHAAVSTRGEFFQANNVTELTDALSSAITRASQATRSEAGVATSSGQLQTDSLRYTVSYNSGAWGGDVVAKALDASGVVQVVAGNEVVRWRASQRRPAHTARNLHTWSGSGGTAFNTAMDAATKALVGTDDLINFIRGDASKESNGTIPGKPFRVRGSDAQLPDFVNSPPVLVKSTPAWDYANLAGSEGSSYQAYVDAKVARSKGVLLIGGNGGMLHAFDAGTDDLLDLNDTGGREVFGFLPRAGLTGLNAISLPSYGSMANPHRYFVDGPTSEADAYISSGTTGWHNVVLGSMGAGGRSVFALRMNLADPTQFSASSVMWEKGPTELGSAMGWVLSDSRVGKIAGSAAGAGWKAFVGNGVASGDGSARLYVLDLATGALEKTIDLDTSSGANGLTGIRLVRNDKEEVYAAYAADLLGNVWRVDFEGPAATDWKVGFKGQPLFKAWHSSTDAPLAITAPPVYAPHDDGGNVVLVGTGRLYENAHVADTTLGSVIAVRDPVAKGASSVNMDSPFASEFGSGANVKQSLKQQTLVSTAGSDFMQISATEPDWSVDKGWYFDLAASPQMPAGTRVIVSPQQMINSVLVTAMLPGTTPQPCEATTGKGFNLLVTLTSGTAPDTPVFDTNLDGKVDSSDDKTVVGYVTASDGRDGLQSATAGLIGRETDGGSLPSEMSCGADPTGICSGNTCLVTVQGTIGQQHMCVPYKLKGVTDRVWKQLVNPPQPS